MPIGRNYQQLFKTLPGFTPPADAHSIPSNPSRALVFNVNGASDSSNNTRIDGVSTTNVWLPHVAAYVPALESLETVNVVTNSFDAEQGLAGGSAINVQIKSGTNQLTGLGVRVLHQRADARAQLLHAGRHAERGLGVSPVRRHARRPDPAQQAVLLRQLREHARQAERHPHDLGADRGAAPRRPLRVGERRSTTRRPATANGTGTDAVSGQHHSRRTASTRSRRRSST